MKISQVLDKIDERQLFVPAFQREYVWHRQHAKDLISSLIELRVIQRIQQRAAANSPFLLPCKDIASFPLW